MDPPFRRLVPLLQRIWADLEQLWGCFRAAFGPLWNALRACLGTVLELLLDGLRVTLQCIRPCLGTGLELLGGGFRATLQCMWACLKFSIPWNTIWLRKYRRQPLKWMTFEELIFTPVQHFSARLQTLFGTVLGCFPVTLPCLGTGLKLRLGGFSGDSAMHAGLKFSIPETELAFVNAEENLEMDDVRRAYYHTHPPFLCKEQRIKRFPRKNSAL